MTSVIIVIGAGLIGQAIAVRASPPGAVCGPGPGAGDHARRRAARPADAAGRSAQVSKRANVLRVQAEAVRWGERGARVNAISPGIVITPLARDELNGANGAGYRRMIELAPAGRAGTPDEIGTVGELLMTERGAFITGSDILIDGGGTAVERQEHSMTQLTRRTLLSAGGVAALTALCGCSPSPGGESAPSSASEGRPERATTPPRTDDPGIVLVYFSRPGENYWEGGRRDLDVGNTKRLAQMIAERIDCDMYEIIAADPYPHAYDPTVERNVREQENDARPEIDSDFPDLSAYDAVMIGSPVWNTRAPMIMRTFLDRADALTGMTVHPFLTYAVGEGSVVDDYVELCPDADVRDGLAVRGEDVDGSGNAVDEWLRGNGLLERALPGN